MMRKRTLLGAVLAAALAATAGAAESGEAPDVKSKMAMCQGCHGLEGYRVAFPEVYSVPKLGGQYPAYIVKALQAYKNGTRSYPTMRAIASSLSDEDMEAIAAYYGGQNTQAAASK